LQDHTTAVEAENRRLEKELRNITTITQEHLINKIELEKENKQLEREEKLRQNLIQIRINRVNNAMNLHNTNQLTEQSKKNDKQKRIIEMVLKNRGLMELTSISPDMMNDFKNLSKIAGMDDKLFEENWLDSREEN
jgi:hypothetical protein